MRTVLIVDDSRIMRKIVKNTFDLLKIPARYLEAENGNDALKQLAENKVNLILLDWNMPKLSGIDFLKQIRGMDDYKDIPVVMITSESERLSVIEAVKAGVTSYITKPINDKVFMDKLSKIAF